MQKHEKCYGYFAHQKIKLNYLFVLGYYAGSLMPFLEAMAVIWQHPSPLEVTYSRLNWFIKHLQQTIISEVHLWEKQVHAFSNGIIVKSTQTTPARIC